MHTDNSWGYEEQIRCHDKLLASMGGIIWWRVGAGKTRIGITLFYSFIEMLKWALPCICVVVTKRSTFLDFRLEIEKLHREAIILEDNLEVPESTKIAMLQKPTFVLISAGSLTKSLPHVSVERVKMVLVDELHMFKNPNSERSLALFKLTRGRIPVGMSGSLMTAQKLEDIYGQLKAVQKHERVAKSFTDFRGRYIQMKMQETKGGKKWPFRFPKPGAYKEVMDKCKDCTDVYYPPNNERKVTMECLQVDSTPEQRVAFNELREFMEIQIKGKVVEYNSALEVALAVQRVANGFAKDGDGIVHEIKTNKGKRVLELAESIIGQGESVVIWCAFHQDLIQLSKLFADKGIATLQFSSKHVWTTADLGNWTQGKIRVCIATEAMGVGVNHFAQTPYGVYYSMSYKWFELQQSMGRHDRKSSKHDHCFYYFLHVQGSLDRQIYNRVLQSRDKENTLIALGEDVTAWLRVK